MTSQKRQRRPKNLAGRRVTMSQSAGWNRTTYFRWEAEALCCFLEDQRTASRSTYSFLEFQDETGKDN